MSDPRVPVSPPCPTVSGTPRVPVSHRFSGTRDTDTPPDTQTVSRLQRALDRLRMKHKKFAIETNRIITELHTENRALRQRLEEYETTQADADG